MLIKSYARIKPLGEGYSDSTGGVISSKSISWDDDTISINDKSFNHLTSCLNPESSQIQCYEVICKPLVDKWLDGFDVDLLSYGQTGSGKTFTMFGPPLSMEEAARNLGTNGKNTISSEGILSDEHGFILRSGFDALQIVSELNSKSNYKAVLHGSMVEMSIMTLQDQSVLDLLNNKKICFVDKEHHLQGAKMILLENANDLVSLAAAVESRSTRGTLMNDTSSRSHCVTVFILSILEGNNMFRQSRLSFYDLMGSERFKGANSAHNQSTSSKSTMGGFEGIYANLSLSSLISAVELATAERKKKDSNIKKLANPMLNFCLTELLQGSLSGSAISGMVTCLSQHPRNGDESYLSLKYGTSMAKLINKPSQQPFQSIGPIWNKTNKEFESVKAIVKAGVNGKYQALREAQLEQWNNNLNLLNILLEESNYQMKSK